MDRIIESFLKTHIDEYGLSNLKKPAAFEHFINRCIINKYTSDRFEPADITTDDGEKGLDGVAIVVNNTVITSLDVAESMVNGSKTLDVKFIFIQSKTSEKFEGSEISNFIYGVKAFFADSTERPKTNEKMENLILIKDFLYSKCINFTLKPSIDFYYVCCGTWHEGNGLQTQINIEIKAFKESLDFSSATFYTYDANKITTTYKELKKKISRKLTMEKRVTFPTINGVTQAYIGFVKCSEFVDILRDTDGKMLTNIFEDNVRDFQGYNAVNEEIRETLSEPADQARFAILNNGITIVAKSIRITGDEIEIFDYQIVNGCQTSYVLFDNSASIDKVSHIVLKVIEVNNEDISDRVIFTTNRQTEVKAEAFTSTKAFHKKLQDFYNSVSSKHHLLYERRSKQYDLVDSINKGKVVTLSSQITSYLACFLHVPHSTHRYYGELLSAHKTKLFLDTDAPDPYYISAYLVHYVETQIKSNAIPAKYKRFKYHIAETIKGITVGYTVNFGHRRTQEKECKCLFELISNPAELQNVFGTSIYCLDHAIEKCTLCNEKDLHRNKDFSAELKNFVQIYLSARDTKEFLKKGDTVHCTAMKQNASFVYVIIKTEDSRNCGSIHISRITGKYISNIRDEIEIGDIFQAIIMNDDFYESEFGWQLTIVP